MFIQAADRQYFLDQLRADGSQDAARVHALREPDLNTRLSETLNALYHPHQD